MARDTQGSSQPELHSPSVDGGACGHASTLRKRPPGLNGLNTATHALGAKSRWSHLQVFQVLQVLEGASRDAPDLVVVEEPVGDSSSEKETRWHFRTVSQEGDAPVLKTSGSDEAADPATDTCWTLS